MKSIKRNLKLWKLEEATTKEFEDWKPKKTVSSKKNLAFDEMAFFDKMAFEDLMSYGKRFAKTSSFKSEEEVADYITAERRKREPWRQNMAKEKSLTSNDKLWYTPRWKGNYLMSKVKKEVPKQSKNLLKEAKLVVVGISQLAFVVAESIAAYVLYFSGQTVALKVVAGVLVIDASIRACKQFVKR